MANKRKGPDAERRGGMQLADLLRGEGVGTGKGWSLRDMAALCDYQVSYQTWQRLLSGERHRWEPETLRIVWETLQQRGSSTTLLAITEASNAAYGYETLKFADARADALFERAKRLSPVERAKFAADFQEFMTAEQAKIDEEVEAIFNGAGPGALAGDDEDRRDAPDGDEGQGRVHRPDEV